MATDAHCRGCGKKIVWAVMNEDGKIKRIPLDPSAPTYTEFVQPEGNFWARSGAMVNHFVTCPKANDFSASKKGGKHGS